MIVPVALAVVVLGALAGWRLRVLSQDIAVLDRDLGRLHEQIGHARQERTEIVQRSEQRHRRAELATSQVHGEVIALRRRVEVLEPWVRHWAASTEEHQQ